MTQKKKNKVLKTLNNFTKINSLLAPQESEAHTTNIGGGNVGAVHVSNGTFGENSFNINSKENQKPSPNEANQGSNPSGNRGANQDNNSSGDKPGDNLVTNILNHIVSPANPLLPQTIPQLPDFFPILPKAPMKGPARQPELCFLPFCFLS